MSHTGHWSPAPRRIDWPDATRVAAKLRSATPALLFGLRLWAAVCLALYIAFALELDNAYWAGTTAAIVSQPHLGTSLRKGWFRLVGTIVGAVAIVALTAIFPQNRPGFLLGLALWCAACAFMATLLRNFAQYSAALAGITAAIIASDQLNPVGGPNGLAFTLAISRASEICIGIVCAGLVLVATDFGGAARRLASLLAPIAAEIVAEFTSTLLLAGSDLPDTRLARRELIRRVGALDPVIDEVRGEATWLRYHSPVFQSAVDGLFAALACWRTIATHLARLSHDQARADADTVLQRFPQALRTAPLGGAPMRWTEDPTGLRLACTGAARTLNALPADSPSLRLLADQAAELLAAVSHTLVVLALLVGDPATPIVHGHGVRLRVPDWLPPLINAGRAFVTLGMLALVWIVTAWPNGATAIAFAAIAVILFSPRADQAYATARSFFVGIILAAVLAAILNFAVLPALAGFAEFSLALGLVLVPGGALLVATAPSATFMALAFLFVPLLAPANQMTYDPQQFYNAASAIVAGIGAGLLAFRLLPPLSPAFQSRRLLTLTLRELRHLATGPVPPSTHDWVGRTYGRLAALPLQSEPLQRAQLLTALCVGTSIIDLRRAARLFPRPFELDAALGAVASGNSAVAVDRLARLDQGLAQAIATQSGTMPGPRISLRLRATIVALSEALARHPAYFDAGAGR